jgi:hypothetical protein
LGSENTDSITVPFSEKNFGLYEPDPDTFLSRTVTGDKT